MKRRDFLVALAGSVAARPLAAAAQDERKRRVGVLVGLAANADVPVAQAFIAPFRAAMREAGWIEGDHVRIDYRFGGALTDLANTRASAAGDFRIGRESIRCRPSGPIEALQWIVASIRPSPGEVSPPPRALRSMIPFSAICARGDISRRSSAAARHWSGRPMTPKPCI
jgi:hypothetical protein